ncbi:putative oxidoreductase [Lysobacter niastensis]|uniref:Oxidoreductase n=1 Tax=Lysobacter niastensis TaxID=380629 RepID=A0ABU1WC58_9GAMM|nr:DoxX family protein [Lysobacter niastensis]MDR7135039.1 putative oxidoreductase [Lysobacter niastensis]
MATLSITDRAPDATGFASFLGLLGRLLMAAIFLISGIGKVTAPAATMGYIASAGLPLPEIAFLIAILVEIVGGIALVIGYRTRFVAAVLGLFCLATAFTFHAQFSDQNQFIHFFKNVTMAGGFLQIVAFGAGRYSLDARRG